MDYAQGTVDKKRKSGILKLRLRGNLQSAGINLNTPKCIYLHWEYFVFIPGTWMGPWR